MLSAKLQSRWAPTMPISAFRFDGTCDSAQISIDKPTGSRTQELFAIASFSLWVVRLKLATSSQKHHKIEADPQLRPNEFTSQEPTNV